MSDTPLTDIIEDCLQHGPSVHRLARSLVGEADADDLSQEVMLIAFRKPPRERAALPAWFNRVTRNLAHNRRLSEARRREHEQRDPGAKVTLSAAKLAEREGIRNHLRNALKTLSEEQQQVLVLRFYENLPPRAIAAQLELPIETVRSRQKRGLARLREDLDSEYGDDRRLWGLGLMALGSAPQQRKAGFALGAAVAAVLFCVVGTLFLLDRPNATGLQVPSTQAEPVTHTREKLAVAAQVEDESARASTKAEVEEATSPAAEVAATMLVIETVDSSGAPVEGWVSFAESAGSYPYAGTTGTSGVVELEVEERYIGGMPLSGWEKSVTFVVEAVDRERSPVIGVPVERNGSKVVRVVLGPPTAVDLSVIVIDSEGRPVESAVVCVGDPAVHVTLRPDGNTELLMSSAWATDSAGKIVFNGVASGRQSILVELEGCLPRWSFCDIPYDRELVLRLDRGATLTGTVRGANGRVVAGAKVHCSWDDMLSLHRTNPSAEAITDEHGEYVLEGLGRQNLLLWAEHPEFPDRIAHAVLARGSEMQWDATLRQSEGIRLRIEDAQGTPVDNASVLLLTPAGTQKWRGEGFTDADGVLSIYRLPKTPMDVFVTREEYSTDRATAMYAVEPSDKIQLITLREEWPPTVSFRGSISTAEGVPHFGRTTLDMRMARGSWTLFEVEATGSLSCELEPGEYQLTLLSDVHGGCDLGTARLNAEHDLGSLESPRVGRLNYAGSWTEGFSYELVQTRLNSGRPISLRLAGGIGPPPSHWDLFPGEFELSIHDPSFREQDRFNISIEGGVRESVGDP